MAMAVMVVVVVVFRVLGYIFFDVAGARMRLGLGGVDDACGAVTLRPGLGLDLLCI